MYNGKKILAIIPARSGSKGLKDKNIMKLNGKPMIAYSIEAAINSGVVDEVVVSTDSEEYAKISEQYGAKVPFLRPSELSTDEATTTEVLVHAIEELEKNGNVYDYFILLQPTSPLRSKVDIKSAVEFCFQKEANSVVSVCAAEHSPLWTNTLDSDLSMSNFLTNNTNRRRQDLSKFYRLNGAIYLTKVNDFMKTKTFYGYKSYAYIMDKRSSIDVDDMLDFKFAEFIMRILNFNNT